MVEWEQLECKEDGGMVESKERKKKRSIRVRKRPVATCIYISTIYNCQLLLTTKNLLESAKKKQHTIEFGAAPLHVLCDQEMVCLKPMYVLLFIYFLQSALITI